MTAVSQNEEIALAVQRFRVSGGDPDALDLLRAVGFTVATVAPLWSPALPVVVVGDHLRADLPVVVTMYRVAPPASAQGIFWAPSPWLARVAAVSTFAPLWTVCTPRADPRLLLVCRAVGGAVVEFVIDADDDLPVRGR